MHVCKFCHEHADDDDLLRYAKRHYAHHRCYLDAGKPLNDLPDRLIVQFPYRLLEERGLTGDAYAASDRFRIANGY